MTSVGDSTMEGGTVLEEGGRKNNESNCTKVTLKVCENHVTAFLTFSTRTTVVSNTSLNRLLNQSINRVFNLVPVLDRRVTSHTVYNIFGYYLRKETEIRRKRSSEIPFRVIHQFNIC